MPDALPVAAASSDLRIIGGGRRVEREGIAVEGGGRNTESYESDECREFTPPETRACGGGVGVNGISVEPEIIVGDEGYPIRALVGISRFIQRI